MTKPWEEEWTAELHGNACDCSSQVMRDREPVFFSNDGGQAYANHGRVRLAAAAPAMARLLLELHREHGNRAVFDWAYWFTEIETVLRKAGVPFKE